MNIWIFALECKKKEEENCCRSHSFTLRKTETALLTETTEEKKNIYILSIGTTLICLNVFSLAFARLVYAYSAYNTIWINFIRKEDERMLQKKLIAKTLTIKRINIKLVNRFLYSFLRIFIFLSLLIPVNQCPSNDEQKNKIHRFGW